MLRPATPGRNIVADHISMLDAALAQIPDACHHGSPLLVRADTAGASKASFFHLRRLHQQGWPANSLLGWATDANATPSPASPPSRVDCDRDGRRRSPPRLEEMAVAELTGLPPISAGYPDGMRTIVHRRRPHSARNSTATHRLSRREVRVGQLRTARCVRRWRTASMGPSLPLCT